MSEQQQHTFESTMEMNFGLSVQDCGRFRMNVFKQRGAVAIVARYVKNTIPSIDSCSLPAVFKKFIMDKRGLILVVGSTGSGKSTTLAAMIDHRNTTQTGHILTIEDPIEFIHKHKKSIVNQREVGLDTHSYDSALMNAMREAPDVLLIREIRNAETMQHGINYAQSGHLCLSTTHANNSYNALSRIVDFFPSDARSSLLLDLSMALRYIISQRLIRGTDGKRIPAIEVLSNTLYVASLIKSGELSEIKEAMDKNLAPGTQQTFEQSLLKLYIAGKISLDEVLKNSDSPTNLSWLINNAGSKEALAKQGLSDVEQQAVTDNDFASFTLSDEMLKDG